MRTISFLIVIVCICSCKNKSFDPEWTKAKAPDDYTIRFETTKGEFDVKVYRAWSPVAADRLYQQVKHQYYDHAIFYRVVEDFVAQFGSSNRLMKEQWMSHPIPDEPVIERNLRGRLSFARAGTNNRGSDLFINLADNPKLDTAEYLGVRGYTPLGEVIKGMEVVEKLYDVYGDDLLSEMDRMYTNRNAFMQAYPGLDYVRKAYLVKSEK